MVNINYQPIGLIDTAGMSEEQWLACRAHGPNGDIEVAVGGSDSGVICGDSGFKSRTQLYFEKRGVEIRNKKPMNPDILNAGHQLEDFVANNFKEYMKRFCNIPYENIRIWNDTMMYQHPFYPFMLANLDRRIIVNGAEGILEIKTTENLSDIKLWKAGIVPKKYEWQCRFYMAVMNLPYTYIACMWGFTVESMAVVKIERDLAIEEVMLETIYDFVECVESGIEPPLQDEHTDTLANFYWRQYGEVPKSSSPLQLPNNEDTANLLQMVAEYDEMKADLDKRTKAISNLEGKIVASLLAMGTAEYYSGRLDDDTVVGVKLQISKKRDVFDTEKFRADHPDIFAEYEEEQTPKMDVTKAKKKYATIMAPYFTAGGLNFDKTPEIKKVDFKAIPLEDESEKKD